MYGGGERECGEREWRHPRGSLKSMGVPAEGEALPHWALAELEPCRLFLVLLLE